MVRIADDTTGYGRQSAPWTLRIDSEWVDPAADENHIAFTRDGIERMSAYSDGSAYIHDNALEDADGLRGACGLIDDRLAQVKAKYDPTALFRVNQKIKPYVEEPVQSGLGRDRRRRGGNRFSSPSA